MYPANETAFLKVLERWRLTSPEGATLLGSNDPRLIMDLRSGYAEIQTGEAIARIRHVLCIYSLAHRLLRDTEAENKWIRERRAELDGSSLLDVMLRGTLEDLILADEAAEGIANE